MKWRLFLLESMYFTEYTFLCLRLTILPVDISAFSISLLRALAAASCKMIKQGIVRVFFGIAFIHFKTKGTRKYVWNLVHVSNQRLVKQKHGNQ